MAEAIPPAQAIAATSTDPSSTPSSQTNGESWALDLLGNWTTKTTGISDPSPDAYTKNPLNQYESVDPDGAGPETPKLFDHDWLGQLRTNQASNQKYVWDLFGRLTKVLDGSGNLIARYRYDAFNRRVEKWVPTRPTADAITRYFYDGWRGIEERALEGTAPNQLETVRARYGFGLGLDEVAWMDRDVAYTGGVPDPSGVPDGTHWTRYYLHQDGLGSVAAVTEGARDVGAALEVTERFTYSAYGAPSRWADGWSVASRSYPLPAEGRSRIGLPYLFTGQRYDDETGLYYYKNRYYDPGNGRFLRRDPVGLRGGLHLYEYAGSAPGGATDPLGLAQYDAMKKMIEKAQFQATRVNDMRYAGSIAARSVAYKDTDEYDEHLRKDSLLYGDEAKDAAESGAYRELTDDEYRRIATRRAKGATEGLAWDSESHKYVTDGGTAPLPARAGLSEHAGAEASRDTLYTSDPAPVKDPDTFADDWWKKHEDDVAACVSEIFDDIRNLRDYLDRAHAPRLDVTKTRKELQQITQSVSPSIVATFRPPPDGIYGTVYIAAEVYGRDPLDDERSYGHELGNLIDGQIYGWDAGYSHAGYPANAREAHGDYDSGNRFEDCLFP